MMAGYQPESELHSNKLQIFLTILEVNIPIQFEARLRIPVQRSGIESFDPDSATLGAQPHNK
jgi:hypothetical protein